MRFRTRFPSKIMLFLIVEIAIVFFVYSLWWNATPKAIETQAIARLSSSGKVRGTIKNIKPVNACAITDYAGGYRRVVELVLSDFGEAHRETIENLKPLTQLSSLDWDFGGSPLPNSAVLQDYLAKSKLKAIVFRNATTPNRSQIDAIIATPRLRSIVLPGIPLDDAHLESLVCTSNPKEKDFRVIYINCNNVTAEGLKVFFLAPLNS